MSSGHKLQGAVPSRPCKPIALVNDLMSIGAYTIQNRTQK